MEAAPDNQDSPRVRFAKREIVKILTALETVNSTDLDLGYRVLALEDELATAREETKRWRRASEALQSLVEKTAGQAAPEQVRALDQAVREWVGRV